MFQAFGVQSIDIIRNILMEMEDGQFLADQVMDAYRNTFHPAGLTTLTDKDEILREFLEEMMWDHACHHGKLNDLKMPDKAEFLETWRIKTFENVRAQWYREQTLDGQVEEMDVNSAYPTIPVQDTIPDYPEDIDYGEKS